MSVEDRTRCNITTWWMGPRFVKDCSSVGCSCHKEIFAGSSLLDLDCNQDAKVESLATLERTKPAVDQGRSETDGDCITER